MKKLLLSIALLLCAVGASAQVASEKVDDQPMMQVYCDVACIYYNLMKDDVNAQLDFGLADKAIHANGWIYNSENNKKMSFSSRMSVFNYMARRGWEYKDAIIAPTPSGAHVWHFILTKKVPVDATPEEIIGDIDYRL